MYCTPKSILGLLNQKALLLICNLMLANIK